MLPSLLHCVLLSSVAEVVSDLRQLKEIDGDPRCGLRRWAAWLMFQVFLFPSFLVPGCLMTMPSSFIFAKFRLEAVLAVLNHQQCWQQRQLDKLSRKFGLLFCSIFAEATLAGLFSATPAPTPGSVNENIPTDGFIAQRSMTFVCL